MCDDKNETTLNTAELLPNIRDNHHWLLGPSVHKIRSCRQDNFSLQSYFLDCVFHVKDYHGDRFSTSASEYEGAHCWSRRTSSHYLHRDL